MTRKIRRYAKKTSMLYSKRGIKGLSSAVLSKLKYACLPFIYRNPFLRGIYHPDLKTVFLELTNKCNLRCEMCNWQSVRKTGYISRRLFESCIDQLSDMKLETLNLQFGGESLLHPDFKNFLRYAINKRDSGRIGCVGLTTNGMLFDRSIADLFVSLKADWVNFSLDGIGQVNDNIRVGSKYSIIDKNIKYLLEKRGSTKKPKVLLNMVDHGKTENQKLEFYDEWVSFVDEIELLPSILPDNSWENKALSENLELAPPPAYCSVPLNTMIITWDGKVTYCCFDNTLKIVLGDASKESIKEIWNGSKFQTLRRAILTNSFSTASPCFKCEFWKINFEPKNESILNGKAKVEYGYIYRRIRKQN